MASIYDNIDRWVHRVLYGGERQNLSGPNVFGAGNRLYSYGMHFEIARLLRDKKGDRTAFLLNGDTYSSSTSGHQSQARRRIESTSVPSVIIPHSALSAAGVEFDTLQIIEALPDRNEEKRHVTYEQPDHTHWETFERFGEVALTDEELVAKAAAHTEKQRAEWKSNRGFYLKRIEQHGTDAFFERQLANIGDTPPEATTVETLPEELRTETRAVGVRDMRLEWDRGHRESWGGVNVTAMPDGTCKYEWTTHKHWLGESLIRARVRVLRTERCKPCKGTGEAAGSLPTLGHCKECHGSGSNSRYIRRWAYFLSGFDHNESRPVYFFCELPRGVKPTTVAEAYEALKPETVKMAEQMGRTVHRQGDIFAVELVGLTKREIRAKGARFERNGRLFSTNHEATETAYLPDGTTLVRGTLWHRPAGRAPDHRRVTVGKSWHIAIKNTVPLSK